MALADKFKSSVEKSQATKDMMNLGLRSVNVNPDDYTVAYGYYQKKSFLKKTMYNYIVALSKDQKDVVVVPLDSKGNCGEAIKFVTSQITSSKASLQSELKINVEGINDTLIFIVPPFTTKDAEAMYQLPIRQEDEAALINQFFKK